jgi:hypothetical protein
MAAKKSGGTKGKAKVKKVMHEYKHGQLKSGGKAKVKSRKQAVAIALSEARQSGAKIPKKGASKKKGAARKKGAAKKKSATKKKSSKR